MVVKRSMYRYSGFPPYLNRCAWSSSIKHSQQGKSMTLTHQALEYRIKYTRGTFTPITLQYSTQGLFPSTTSVGYNAEHQKINFAITGMLAQRTGPTTIPNTIYQAGNFGVVSGIFLPQNDDMPTCHTDMSAPTVQTILATSSHVGYSNAMSMSCRHADMVTCRHYVGKKTASMFYFCKMNKHTTIKQRTRR